MQRVAWFKKGYLEYVIGSVAKISVWNFALVRERSCF